MSRSIGAIRALIATLALSFGALACGGPVQRFEPPGVAPQAISHDGYRALLAAYVTADGRVDYGRWQASDEDIAALDAYLGNITAASPENRPALFAAPADRLSYWINLYNALVLREVIRRWPIGSVRQVKSGAVSYLVPGKGFFAGLRFSVGDRSMSLDDIEHQILRGRFADARIHFAINCGSSSCPVLSRDAFDAAQLESQLEQASASFINAPANVAVDHDKRQVMLSKIFEWYGDDFVAHARRTSGRSGEPDARLSLIDFLLIYAHSDLASDLARAQTGAYELRYREYDWSVNSGDAKAPGATGAQVAAGSGDPGAARPADPAAHSPHPMVGEPFPALSFDRLGGGTIDLAALRGKVVLLDVWATYCKPCRASFPAIETLWASHRERGFEIVALSQDEDPALVKRFVDELGVTFPIASDPEQKATEPPLSITSLPTEILIDRQGVVRFHHTGAPDMDALTAALETLLAEP